MFVLSWNIACHEKKGKEGLVYDNAIIHDFVRWHDSARNACMSYVRSRLFQRESVQSASLTEGNEQQTGEYTLNLSFSLDLEAHFNGVYVIYDIFRFLRLARKNFQFSSKGRSYSRFFQTNLC